MIVVNLVAPPAELSGYLRRYLLEAATGTFVGSVSAKLSADIASAVEVHGARGSVLVAKANTEQGFKFLYYCFEDRRLIDSDGVTLVEGSPKSVLTHGDEG